MFVGPSGEVLDELLSQAGVNREELFIARIGVFLAHELFLRLTSALPALVGNTWDVPNTLIIMNIYSLPR